jgi:hypothetical protein
MFASKTELCVSLRLPLFGSISPTFSAQLLHQKTYTKFTTVCVVILKPGSDKDEAKIFIWISLLINATTFGTQGSNWR